MRSGNWRLSSSSWKISSPTGSVGGGRRMTTPMISLSLTLSARAAPSGMKPSSATAARTRSRVSAIGLPRPLRTRETEAIDTPAALATS